jgi:proline iminopeptidase
VNRDQRTEDLLYPAIEPYLEADLAVGPGHRIHYELSGNPQGFPLLFLHGGPGSQTRPGHRCYFDPRFYRIVLFDQRGCGRSSPAGEVHDNTTHHLIADIEQLRLALGVERWLLFGGSWGSTLALAYAGAHPGRVAAMILRGVFLASSSELEWYLNGLRRFVPEAWQQLSGGDGRDLVARYHSLVNHPDPQTAASAAQRWVDYEVAAMAMGAPAPAAASQTDADALVARSRVQLHYLANRCFLREGELLEGLHRLAGTPAIVVQGRRDMICPPHTAWEVASRLPRAELRMIADGGHAAGEAPMAPALRRAADDLRERL